MIFFQRKQIPFKSNLLRGSSEGLFSLSEELLSQACDYLQPFVLVWSWLPQCLCQAVLVINSRWRSVTESLTGVKTVLLYRFWWLAKFQKGSLSSTGVCPSSDTASIMVSSEIRRVCSPSPCRATPRPGQRDETIFNKMQSLGVFLIHSATPFQNLPTPLLYFLLYEWRSSAHLLKLCV